MRKAFFISVCFILSCVVKAELPRPTSQYLQYLNLLINPGFENGKVGWVASGTSSSAGLDISSGIRVYSPGPPGKALLWNTIGGQTITLRSALASVPYWLYGRDCRASIRYAAAGTLLASEYTFNVIDQAGTSLVTGLSFSTTSITENKTGALNFTCPSTGSFQIEVKSSSDAPDVLLDDGYLGENYSPSTTINYSTQAGGTARIEVAKLNCDAGSAITSQRGTWVSSIGNISLGSCTVTLTTGIFSTAPYCVQGGYNTDSDPPTIGVKVNSATQVVIDCANATTDCTEYDLSLICIGAN